MKYVTVCIPITLILLCPRAETRLNLNVDHQMMTERTIVESSSKSDFCGSCDLKKTFFFQLIPEDDFCLPEGVPDAATIREGVLNSEMGTSENLDAIGQAAIDPGRDTMSSRPPHLLPVPFEIRPRLGCFRVEILFWGVRELQRIQLMAVDRPKVTIEFGGEHVSSDTIQSAKLKPNFPNPIKYIDLVSHPKAAPSF